jgi:hypothetical protein
MPHDELTPEELEAQEASPLPDREVMSVLPVPGSEIHIDPFPGLEPPPEDEAPPAA